MKSEQLAELNNKELREIATAVKADGMRCNCDLDNWEPERTTDHSRVCRIHKMAMAIKFRPHDVKTEG